MRILALDTATEACSVAILAADELFGVFKEVGRGHAEEILGMVDATLAEAGLTLGQLDGIAASIGPGAFTGIRIGVSVAQGLAFGAGLPVIGVTTLEALAVQALRLAAGALGSNEAGRAFAHEARRAGGAGLGHKAGRESWPDLGASLGHAVGPESRPDLVLACLDARMGEVYWGCFAADALRGVVPSSPMTVGAAESVRVPCAAPFHGIGRGFAAYPSLQALPGLILRPDAAAALPASSDMARLGAIRLEAGEGLDPAELTPLYLRDKVALTEIERAAVRTRAGRVDNG